MEAKKSNITVHAHPTKVAKSAIVVVGVKAKGCYWTLDSIQSECVKCIDMAYSTALLKALHITILRRMVGTGADELSSQITNLDCSYQNGEFNVKAMCTGSFTNVRKTAANIIKWMNPASVYPAYKECLKQLSTGEHKFSADKNVFINVANAFAKSANASVNVFIGGKVKLAKEHVQAIADACHSKYNVSLLDGAGTAPEEKKAEHPVDHVSVPASGVEAMLVKRYIDTLLNINSHAADGVVYIPAHLEKHLKTLGDKDRIVRYVGTKYNKFGDELPAAMAFLSANHSIGTVKELVSYSKKPTDIAKAIQAAFK